ncbi:hypothetical protein NO559_05365 [Dasania sp. GY-MA-18]|uniref:Uncharacterized protein n=1 Tax=Dasania phycosphaerae TaxID=2950436 RepID=A0A9J6RJS6_9GAMM|nr:MULTISPECIES: hypothetical protein [Dasania]MCR8922189.1 hypothetical protein [Dasania sp. GY-MA-18]MCZ0864617.1 hypothetical protein [Dasania phycosphaerae]MCZ0868345.1 hypothetical protein [Dasania phycosphaerae]
MALRLKTIALLSLCSLLLGCQPDSSGDSAAINPPAASAPAIDVTQLHHRIAQQAELSLRQSIASAQALLARSQQFLEHSDTSHWQQLRAQWLASHRQWHHSASYLALLPAQPELIELQQRLHSHDISAGYLDSIEGYPQSGIVNDSTLHLSLANLAQQHQRYSDEEAALGLSVLEFFIWGRELSHYSNADADALTQLALPRRRDYLALLAQQWLSDVESAHAYWQAHHKQLPAATEIRILWQQQLGAIANGQHSPYSQDSQWPIAVLTSISLHTAAHPNYASIAQLLQQPDPDPLSLNQQLGELMLALSFKDEQ